MTASTSPASRRRTLVLGAVCAGSVLLAAPAAPSVAGSGPDGLVTHCTGTAGPVTVPGDLLVPAGESCLLQGTTVLGDVDVRAGADLVAEDGAVLEGAVLVRADAYLEVDGASVHGQVDLRASYGGFAVQATMGDVDVRNSGFYYTESTTQGGYHGVNTETFLESSWVAGDVTTRSGIFVDVDDTVVTGVVDIRNPEQGSFICSSEIDGDVLLRGASAGVVQLGAGSYPDCAGNVFGGDLELRAHSGDGTFVAENIVRGDLVCAGNDPAPVGAENRVRGELVGQCAGMEPEGSSSFALSDVAARGGDTRALIDERSQHAREQAEQAGQVEIAQPRG